MGAVFAWRAPCSPNQVLTHAARAAAKQLFRHLCALVGARSPNQALTHAARAAARGCARGCTSGGRARRARRALVRVSRARRALVRVRRHAKRQLHINLGPCMARTACALAGRGSLQVALTGALRALPCAHGPSRAASSMLPSMLPMLYVREANERTTGWIIRARRATRGA